MTTGLVGSPKPISSSDSNLVSHMCLLGGLSPGHVLAEFQQSRTFQFFFVLGRVTEPDEEVAGCFASYRII